MKHVFESLYELQKKNLTYSAWAKQTSLKDRVKELQSEVQELMEEVETKQWDKFGDEMGDVFWDCLGVMARAEQEGHFDSTRVLEHIYQKFTERKPFLLEEKHPTREEESRLWREVKAKQKSREINLK
jgi:NTP pyrophosphatase (non-canonical NTP hydrolase)